MQYTPNYNLITVEGTDVVNPLVQMNPNFTDIDAAMFANKQASIGSATELTSGTVHAITRANPDSNYFRFTATSNWTAGDSMTIDGVAVSVFLTDGTLPGTGAYVINSEVFGILTGSRVTLFLTNPLLTLPATDVTFNPAGTGLVSTNIDGAVRELDTAVQSLNNTAVVTGVLDGTIGTPAAIPYPTGYDISNTVIIGAMYESAAGIWSQFTNNNAARFDAILYTNAISIIPRDAGATGKPVRIVLQKI